MEQDNFFKCFSNFKEYYTRLLQEGIYDCNYIQTCISTYYKKLYGILYHISDAFELNTIIPTYNYDMYGKEFSKKVFATSNPYEIWLYACRTVSGEMHEKNRVCIYPSNPFLFYKKGYYYLKRNVAVYMLNSEDFLPVIKMGFRDDKEKLYFDNEWVSNQETMPLYCYIINRIPEEFTKYYAVYYWDSKDDIKYPNSLEEFRRFRKIKIIKKITVN